VTVLLPAPPTPITTARQLPGWRTLSPIVLCHVYLSVCSAFRILVNVLPPPNFFIDQVTDGYAYDLSSIGIEFLVHKLI
jgi:hypothetical protein